ncbi:MAG TPA: GNAT family N-acetyltransferase [Anaerolineales bacterium]|nr:GNAT family N-acetyltransferase [Anaerolineales bacterium]
MLIRRALIEESFAIASILREAFIEFEPLYTPAAFATTTPTSDQIQKRWYDGPVWVAVQNQNLVATVAAVPKRAGLYIRSMAVLPIARGQRIAWHLLSEIESFAMTNHHKHLFLSTTPFLKSAIHLYESFGFQPNAQGPHDLFGTPLFTMVKPLEPTDGGSKNSFVQNEEMKPNEQAGHS